MSAPNYRGKNECGKKEGGLDLAGNVLSYAL